jgi:hypothetical protein
MNAIRHGRELGQPRVRRHRLSIADGTPPGPPPITGTPPSLGPLRSGDTLDSATTWGTYSGTGTVTTQRQARVNGGTWNPYVGTTVVVDGQTWQLRERVSDDFNTNQIFLGNIVTVQSVEADLLALFATKRLGYCVDPRNKSSMLQTGDIPVTTNGQSLAEMTAVLGSPAFVGWVAAAPAQPLWVDNSVDPDGVDDVIGATGPTEGFPDFLNLAGYVACISVTPGPMRLQTFWTVGFGGTVGNARFRIQGRADGSVMFSVNDGVARRDFSTPIGTLVDGTPVLLTLFVDFQTREAKGFVNGVQQASFTLLNPGDIVSVASNRTYFFRAHANATEFADAKLNRAAFLHDRTDAAGRATMEAWVGEFV